MISLELQLIATNTITSEVEVFIFLISTLNVLSVILKTGHTGVFFSSLFCFFFFKKKVTTIEWG